MENYQIWGNQVISALFDNLIFINLCFEWERVGPGVSSYVCVSEWVY